MAHQFINVEAYSFDVGFYDACAVLEELRLTDFFVLSPACLLRVRLALILKHNLFNFVTVGSLFTPYPPTFVCPMSGLYSCVGAGVGYSWGTLGGAPRTAEASKEPIKHNISNLNMS